MVCQKWVVRHRLDVQKFTCAKNSNDGKPFAYKKVFTNLYSNYIFHEDIVPMLQS